MDKNIKKVKRMVYRNLDKIYSTSKSIIRSYGYKMIPMSLVKELIENSKLKPNNEIPQEFIENYNAVLDVLYKTCNDNATKKNLVDPKNLKLYIQKIKASFSASV